MEKKPIFVLFKIPHFIVNKKIYCWSVAISSKLMIPHSEVLNAMKKTEDSEMFKPHETCGIITYNVSKEGIDFIFDKILNKEEKLELIQEMDLGNSRPNDNILSS